MYMCTCVRVCACLSVCACVGSVKVGFGVGVAVAEKRTDTHIACYIWCIGLSYIALSVLYMLQQKQREK